MSHSVSIGQQFNGPPKSGNGGYSCGVLAAFVEGPAKVRLFIPPPLEQAMTINQTASTCAEMYQGDTLVGRAEASGRSGTAVGSDAPSGSNTIWSGRNCAVAPPVGTWVTGGHGLSLNWLPAGAGEGICCGSDPGLSCGSDPGPDRW